MEVLPHLDTAAIAELKDIMEGEFNSLVDIFVNDSSARLEGVHVALSSGDADAVRRAAHAFKGASANIGARHLASLCKTIEEKGASGDVSGCDEILKNIRLERDVVVDLLNQERV